MPVYVWKGVNSYGEKRKGKIEAHSEAAALSLLKKIRIKPTVLKVAPKDLFSNITMFQPKVTGKDVVIFTRMLSTMIDAGLPLVQSVDILAGQQENITFKKILTDIRIDVESGMTFADAMKKHPKVFDNLYCNMIDAGEVGGILDTILTRLAKDQGSHDLSGDLSLYRSRHHCRHFDICRTGFCQNVCRLRFGASGSHPDCGRCQ
jgi:type IV pilus assembly protein PilC